ncbi:glycoside hydrolase family 2 protein [Robinsoniella peoriensis]|uniref:Beta-galactosidase n=1 Tax=Robinsoniella peoriensis TaxID=180332 RepID=A0A4U8Q8J6_9FIRM|nr:glycoside hydrolase family 2 TIM barrel-domain containing protein [Clostridiales bacterium]TLD01285.1 Beta-galactosidase [Robinsoniella peoriensis]
MMRSYKKDYPRPQLVRQEWENLNGTWDFLFDDRNVGEKEKFYTKFPGELKIEVPFTYETKLSGIGDENRHDHVWYRKKFTADKNRLEKEKLMLHFEGSDFLTKVWVNGELAGSHRGGYSRFSFDISNFIRDGENEIIVKADDSFDMAQPRGKQRWKDENFGCWYVQTTGIWKTVWLEYVPVMNLSSVKITPLLEKDCVELELEITADSYPGNLTAEVEISFQGTIVNKSVISVLESRVETRMNVFSREADEWGVRTWSPERPDLYDISIRILEDGNVCDEVLSYFGMREIRIDRGNILLNGRPLYQRLILDQGYWEDSHLTPPNEEALVEDIEKIMKLGYNGLRKHQKVEDERFLYWCDVKGMLVWSEVPAAYRFSDDAVQEFTEEWMDIVRQNYNHPSIITWTPFNESWGISKVETDRKQQHFTEAVYHLTKSFDRFRPVIVNDGWEHTVSDIITLHDYEEYGDLFFDRYNRYKEEILSTDIYHSNHKSAMADGYAYKGQPVIISEYGGIAFQNGESGWGYGNKVGDEAEFIKRFDSITTAIKKTPYICGFCYTQVTDVQQEINGLMNIDRSFKVDPEVIKEINERPGGCWRAE